MPFALIVVGVLMIVVALRNTQSQLGMQIVRDFTGSNNFFYWIAAIFIIGAVGYIDALKAPSRAFLALLLIALVLANRGFFNQFVNQLQAGSAHAPPPGPPAPTIGGASGGGGGAASGASPTSATIGGINLNQAISAATTIGSFL